ncbi:hypothetical protein SDC9_185677 [bioreactor metagenome]|uniref:Uncharacterized protein n=1 Tax=bioreactor metagenome TaxID=1076179 RepID=A0A645HRZ6_9ZZZZ
MVDLNVDKGSSAQKREHPGKTESAGQHIAQHTFMTKQRGKVANSSTQAKRLATLYRQSLFDQCKDHHRRQNSRHGEDPKDIVPAQPYQHPATDNRCH